MGYEIVYEKKKKRSLGPLAAAWFLVFCLIVGACWPEGREMLRSLLFPGDWTVTAQAAETFALDLKAGEPLGAAVEAFCGRIFFHELAAG